MNPKEREDVNPDDVITPEPPQVIDPSRPPFTEQQDKQNVNSTPASEDGEKKDDFQRKDNTGKRVKKGK